MSDDTVLRVRELTVSLNTRHGSGRVVNGVSFDLRRGQTVGLVGESGSGKTMTALALLQVLPPAAVLAGGSVELLGRELVGAGEDDLERVRGRHIAYIPQDPMSSLNPVYRIGRQIAEPLARHRGLRGAPARARATELLRQVHVPTPEERLRAYPHEFSGGMRQRVVSATALSCKPEVLLADEPTTSLDVTVQAAYLETLKEIQRAEGLAVLFITHDLGIVANICDRVVVLYSGRIVEEGPTREIFERPAHPYTQGLLASIPDPTVTMDQRHKQELPEIGGQPPSVFDRPAGCAFRPRCPYGNDPRCADEVPPLRAVGADHRSACWYDIPAGGETT